MTLGSWKIHTISKAGKKEQLGRYYRTGEMGGINRTNSKKLQP
jgi:hypothetical protein